MNRPLPMRMNGRSAARAQAGFTLVELLLANVVMVKRWLVLGDDPTGRTQIVVHLAAHLVVGSFQQHVHVHEHGSARWRGGLRPEGEVPPAAAGRLARARPGRAGGAGRGALPLATAAARSRRPAAWTTCGRTWRLAAGRCPMPPCAAAWPPTWPRSEGSRIHHERVVDLPCG